MKLNAHQRFHGRMGFCDEHYNTKWIMFGSSVRIGVLVMPKAKDADDVRFFRKRVIDALDEMMQENDKAREEMK